MEFDDYLPLGGHLLSHEFQSFLVEWNMAIAAYSNEEGEEAWLGESRKQYERDHPELWEAYKAEFKRLNALYPEEVKAVKKYQKDYPKTETEASVMQAAQAAQAAQEAREKELAERLRIAREKLYEALAAYADGRDKNEVSSREVE
jgi:hypothetical protein